MRWQNVKLSKDVSRTLQIITCSKHASTTTTASPLSLHPHPRPTPMAPNKYFDNMKQTIKRSTWFIPCPACNRCLKSKGGFTKHMGSAHANYQGHFSSQFVYSTNKIDGDEDYDYGYNYADNDDSSTDNDNNAPSPLHVASSVFPLLPVQPASPDTAYIEHSWLMDVDQDFDNKNKDASSSSDIPYSTFFDQSHSQANRPNTRHQTAPKENFTRTYHPKLNGKC